MGCFQTGLAARSADVTVDTVTRSMRLAGSHYLTKTFANSGNRKTYTIAFWVKRSKVSTSSTQVLFSAAPSGHSSNPSINQISFRTNDTLEFYQYPSGSQESRLATAAVFRDTSAWLHCCFSVDTTQATEADRVKIFVNGVLQSVATYTDYPSQNHDSLFNGAYEHKIGEEAVRDRYNSDILISDFYFIDGEAKSPTDFIELGDYGNYITKEYTGSFGHNGFHLDNQPENSADLLIQSAHHSGSTSFVDSANGIPITASGNARHTIFRASPFASNERSAHFDGVNDYIKVSSASSDFAFGTGDYTIEGWFYFSSLSGVKTICDLRPFNSSDSTRAFFGTTGSGLYVYFNGGNTTLAASGSLTTNRWHHIAFVRSSGSLKTYIDGKLKTTVSANDNHNTNGTPHLGSTARFDQFYNVNHEAFLQGYIYDFRIVKGTAVYTGEFTAPDGKLSSTGGSYPSTTNVNTSITSGHTVLHIQPEKGGSIDDETSNHTITVTGAVMPSSSPYEPAAKSSSIFFDGYGDYLQTAASSDLTFGTGSFTVELWFMPYGVNTSSSYDGIISDELYSSTGGWALLQRDDELSLWVKNTGGNWVSFVADGALTAYQWQHLAVSYDSSTTTTRLFVDGTAVVSGTTSGWNLTGDQVEVGRSTSSGYVNGVAYDIRVTKGSALYTADFDEPTAPFEVEPVFIGADHSGNRLHWEPTNIRSHDIMLDTPTKNYAVINPLAETKTDSDTYTPNPTSGLSEGNLKLTSSEYFFNGHGTLGVSSGKWYFEWYSTGDWTMGGFSDREMFSNKEQSLTDFWVLYNRDSTNDIAAQYKSGSSTVNAGWAGGSQASGNGNIYGCAFDVDNRKMYFHKNGEWSDGTSTLTSTFPSSYGGDLTGSSHSIPADTTFYPVVRPWTNSTVIANFGQDNTFAGEFAGTPSTDEFAYSPPSGFNSLNTNNLPDPTLTPTNNFDVLTYNGAYDSYTGEGTASQTITGTDFTPSIVWIKDRDNLSYDYNSAYNGHYWFDSIMGTGYAINVDLDNSSHSGTSLASGEDGISSFNSNGFTVDEAEETNYKADTDYDYEPDTGERYVAWCWKLGSTGSSSTWASGNTDPDSEKYNALAGVSIVNYYDENYTSSAITLNHSLGAAPEVAIAFDYDGYISEHYVWHKDLSSNNYLTLDSSSGQSSDSSVFPANPATATTITLGLSICSGVTSHVALFTPVEGFSKFGSYVGNENNDGPFIYTGFRPALVIIKKYSTSGASKEWWMMDNKRDGYNPTKKYIFGNTGGAEGTSTTNWIDFTANGFKLRGYGATTNKDGWSYLYLAFAESPFSGQPNAH